MFASSERISKTVVFNQEARSSQILM